MERRLSKSVECLVLRELCRKDSDGGVQATFEASLVCGVQLLTYHILDHHTPPTRPKRMTSRLVFAQQAEAVNKISFEEPVYGTFIFF